MGNLSLLRPRLDSLHEGALLAYSGALPSVALACDGRKALQTRATTVSACASRRTGVRTTQYCGSEGLARLSQQPVAVFQRGRHAEDAARIESAVERVLGSPLEVLQKSPYSRTTAA